MPITALPTPPGRNDPANFATRADAFLAALPAFATEANALAVDVMARAATITTQAAQADAAAALAQQAGTAAQGAANYKGLWSALAGALAIPASVFHAGSFWVLTSALANVAAAEPGKNAVWQAIGGLVAPMPTARPSLLLDFANGGKVDPRITFTRASTSIRVNAKGLLESVPSGTPVIDFDPVTGRCLGLRCWEARTNLATYSDDFSQATWAKTGITATANSAVAPDGTTTADTLANTGGINSFISRAFTVAASLVNDYCASVFVKPISPNDDVTLQAYYSGSALNINATFKFSDMSVTNMPNAGEYIFEQYPNGWYRIGFRIGRDTTGVATVINYRLLPSGRNDATGDVYAWGAQFEAGGSVSPYIPTVASTVTRAADLVSMTGANFSSWYRADAGTFVVDADAPNFLTIYRPFAATDGTVNNRVTVTQTNALINPFTVSGNVSTSAALTPKVLGQIHSAIAYANDDSAGAADGIVQQFTNPCPVPIAPNQLTVGSQQGAGHLNGHIARLVFYPVRLPNAQLQALTAQ